MYVPIVDSTGTNVISLTSVFGMGTGVAKLLWPSRIRGILGFLKMLVGGYKLSKGIVLNDYEKEVVLEI